MEIIQPTDTEIVNAFMDNMEVFISKLPPVEIGIEHIFARGVYIRKMICPAGALLTSKVHKTESAFIVSGGRILVYDGEHEAVILQASYNGITLPGTRRMGIALENLVWFNIHPTRIKPKDNSEAAVAEAVAKIEKIIIEPYSNLKLIKGGNQWPG
jgi:hypothetical protein